MWTWFEIPMVHLPSSKSVELADSSEAMSSPAPARSYALGGFAETDAAFVRSVAWTGGVKWSRNWLVGGPLSWLRGCSSPQTMGLVGMATVYFGLVTMLSDFGLATAVVTLRQLKDEQISQINSLSVLLGVACFLISLLAAGPLAVFYRNPQVYGVVCVMSLSFLISGFKAIPLCFVTKTTSFQGHCLGGRQQSDPPFAQYGCFRAVGFGLLVVGLWRTRGNFLFDHSLRVAPSQELCLAADGRSKRNAGLRQAYPGGANFLVP